MSTLWLLPLAIGAVGSAALGLATRRLAREVEALRGAMRPLRAHPGAAEADDRRRLGGT